MKILLSAIACNPEHGSESGVGWKAATALSKRHEVHVLANASERKYVDPVLAAGAYPNLSFTYFGEDRPYHQNRLIARLQSWLRYLNWTKQSLHVASRLTGKERFDLAHHVTYSSWRIPSPFWKLSLPFIWGPVGGAAEYPGHLLGKLSTRSAVFEVARGLSNLHASRSSALRDCVRNSAAVVASNRETLDKLLALRGRSEGMHLLFPTFFTGQQVAMFQCDPADKPPADPIRLFAGGNIIGSKGLIFALEALRIAAQRGINWRLTVGGYGPEVPFLEKKSRAFGIDHWIRFHKGFSGDAYLNTLKQSHLYILPSFRENAGITMLEAMLAGCVPLIVDASAQGSIVDVESGFKVPVGSADRVSAGLANALEHMAKHPQLRVQMGRKASDLVAFSFREEKYCEKVEEIYRDAISHKTNTPCI